MDHFSPRIPSLFEYSEERRVTGMDSNRNGCCGDNPLDTSNDVNMPWSGSQEVTDSLGNKLLPVSPVRHPERSTLRASQSISPSRWNGSTLDGSVSESAQEGQEEFRARSKSGSKAIRDWFGRSPTHSAGRRSPEDGTTNCNQKQNGDTSTTEFRPRTGSKGLKDLLRIKTRRHHYSEVETRTPDAMDSSRQQQQHQVMVCRNGGQGTPGAAGLGMPGISRMKEFLGTFRHRTHSDSVGTDSQADESEERRSTLNRYRVAESNQLQTAACQQQHRQQLSSSVGPADFLEMYRTRTMSDPRPDMRLRALTRVRMHKLCRESPGSLRGQQVIVWKDRLAGDQIFTLPTPDAISLQSTGQDVADKAADAADADGNDEQRSPEMSVRRLLSSITCYDVMPENGRMIVFDSQLAVKKALFALLENNVSAAPVWDSGKQTITGMLTVTDFIAILHHHYRLHPSELSTVEQQTISSWRVVLESDGRPLVHVRPDSSLLDVFDSLRGATVRRLLVIDPCTGNAVHFINYFTLLHQIYAHIHSSVLSELDKTIDTLCVRQVDTVTEQTPLIDALGLLLSGHVTALPVVDCVTSQLLDIYCKSDVINLAINSTYSDLDVSVGDALRAAGQQRFESLQTCQKTDNLRTVISKLVSSQVYQLVIVDSNGQVEGLVSQSDVLEFLISS